MGKKIKIERPPPRPQNGNLLKGKIDLKSIKPFNKALKVGPVCLERPNLPVSASPNLTFQNGPSLELSKRPKCPWKRVHIPTKSKAYLAPLRLSSPWNFQCPKWHPIPTKMSPKIAPWHRPIWALEPQGPDAAIKSVKKGAPKVRLLVGMALVLAPVTFFWALGARCRGIKVQNALLKSGKINGQTSLPWAPPICGRSELAP